MPKHRAAGMIFSLACAGGLTATADAQVAGSWIGSATGQWTTSANWTSNPQFPSSNGTAIFNAGQASVALGTTIQLQHLKLDTPAQITFTQNSLTFGSGAPLIEVPRSKLNPTGVYYYTGHDFLNPINTGSGSLQVSGPGALTWRGTSGFTASLQLSNGVELGVTTSGALGSSFGSILLDNGTLRTISASGAATISSIDIPRSIQVLPGGGTLSGITAPLRINQQIAGGGPLTFAGPAGVRLDSDINWAGDARVVGGGTSGLSISNTGALRFYNNLTVGGTVNVTYNSGAQDRLGAGTITLRGGILSLTGLGTSESVGTIVLDNGHNTVALGGTSGTFILAAEKLIRRNRATLNVAAEGLGTISGGRITKITFNDPSSIPLVGGGGPAGSPHVSIIPFASKFSGITTGLMTYDAGGLRVLNSNTEYVIGLPAEAISTANVRPQGEVVSSPQTVNSLVGGSLSGPGTITVTSGAVLGVGSLSCALHFGTSEGVITGADLLIGPISGSNGITINSAAGGPLDQTMLSANQSTYTGITTLIGNTQVFLASELLPKTPGPFGMDSSPIILIGQGIGSFGSRLGFTGATTRIIGRDLIVRSDVDLMKGHEPSLSMTGQSFNGKITLEGPLRINGGGTFNGVIDGPGRLILNPSPSAVVVLAGSNTFQGGVDLQVASLTILHDRALGTGTLFVGDGIINTLNATLSIGSSVLTPRTLTNPIVLSDTLAIVASGAAPAAGTLILNGPVNLNGELRGVFTNGVRAHFNGPISDGEIRFGGEGTLAGNNSQRGTYILVSPTNFSRVTVTHSNGLGGVDAKLTQVGSFGFTSGLTRLELRGGLDIPAHQLLLHDELRNGEGNNIWRGPINANGGPTFNILADSFTAMSGINGAGVGATITKQGGGTLHTKYFRAEQRLNIAAGVVRVLPNGTDAATSSVASLTIAGAPDAWQTTFDLADNALVIHDSTALATIQNQLLSGYANGSWNGTGIQTSTAANDPQHRTGVGLALGSDLFTTFPATFAGVSVNADSVLLRYTLYGDANLDRTVNITDFAILAANFNTPTMWSRGDFNYDNLTNIADFALLAANFNQSLPIDLPRQSIPEPVAASMLGCALLLRRRTSVTK